MIDQQPKSKIRFISIPLFILLFGILIIDWFNLVDKEANQTILIAYFILFIPYMTMYCGNCRWSGLKVNSLMPQSKGLAFFLSSIKPAFKFMLSFIFAKRCPSCGKERY
ncbi:MAG: hypothetical protein COB49_08720 [Alphaproteobacteria bacterium]|nr:MAG: hypothetical protein COB49_08720 [Alphaproteobacteria bacterium]